ncbi:MAG: DegT/DnrJ/EryC1/StrS family aminotransferase [Thermoanaerobaculia bacterium]
MPNAPRGLPLSAGRPQIGIGGCQISDRARELVLQVLDSNRLSAGPMMDRFERMIAAAHDRRYGLMCNSGTSALQIALQALKEIGGWADGDEVLVPAITFVATANVVLYNGLRPVFVDVDPDFYEIDPAQIERHVTPRTRAIIPVHVGGLPCDMGPIMEIARRRRLRVIEDSAEAMFVRYKGKPVGSFGDVACFSTYIAHLISTGVGGLCVTDDPEIEVLLKSIMNHGRDSLYTRIDDHEGISGDSLLEVARSRFSFVRLGHSFRATEMEAALGIAELERREETTRRRQEVVARMTRGLESWKSFIQLPRSRPETEDLRMFFPLRILDSRIVRDDLIRHLEDRSIETRYLLPLINQPVYRSLFGDLEPRYPVAAMLNRTAFYVGSHPAMSDEDVDYVADCFADFFRAL